MPRRVDPYAPHMGFDTMNWVSTAGVFAIVVATLVFIWNILQSLRDGKTTGSDPWGGATLEWATPPPPPPHNFGSLPTVHSVHPLWEADASDVVSTANRIAEPIHMP